MNERLKYILICFYFIFGVLHSQNNRNVIDIIADNFQKLTDNQSLDNIYLQTSKSIYETEENLWFKAYVLNAQYLTPSKRNKTLYIQLINDETKQAVWKEKYEIENGFVDGHLYIQDSLKTGRYSLAAYSEHSYFRNQEAFYALKKVTIVKNIKEKINNTAVKNDSIAQFSLFPEGGYLVSDIENTLAFKATNKKGLPVDVSGVLYENNLPLFNFKSIHAGMGSINFMPKKTNNYYIQLTESDKKYPLPEIKPTGKTLSLIANTNDFLTFKIAQSRDLKPESIYLQLQIRGIIYSVASAKLRDEIIIKIPLKDIPQGIAEITLINTNLKPIAERLVYVKQDQKLNIKTILNKSEYKTREKATLKIKATDKDGEPVEAHLGLSIYDNAYQNKFEPKNILTHYHLSTQLKGNIYDPIYYFNEDNINRHDALNLLLLTQGWRRYVWNEENLKENKLRKPILSDSITGKIRLDRVTKKPKTEQQQVVMAYTPDSLRGKDFIFTDSNGILGINYKHFKLGEKGYFYIKPLTQNKPKYVIDIKDNSFDIININSKTTPINYPFPKLKVESLEDNREPLIVSDKVNKLDEVVLSAKKDQVFRNKYLGALDSLAKLELTDYVCRYGNLNCINHPEDYRRKPIEGKIYLAENRVSRVPYREKKYTEEELLNKFNLKMLKGYYGKREFYQPIYDKETVNDPFPDYRNTLFWKPDIITNEQGEAIIEFYCSDLNTIFTGSIEGVSGTGLLGTDSFNFKVYKK
ncbi:hypothetical protein [Formosa haliotis]|uniref:hypothetical protein n=1 Tax=Formosa haliotis TaxID=1555194 RepID=UPI00082400C9|nr:hypothetical protein [Formosa haliotis]